MRFDPSMPTDNWQSSSVAGASAGGDAAGQDPQTGLRRRGRDQRRGPDPLLREAHAWLEWLIRLTEIAFLGAAVRCHLRPLGTPHSMLSDGLANATPPKWRDRMAGCVSKNFGWFREHRAAGISRGLKRSVIEFRFTSNTILRQHQESALMRSNVTMRKICFPGSMRSDIWRSSHLPVQSLQLRPCLVHHPQTGLRGAANPRRCRNG